MCGNLGRHADVEKSMEEAGGQWLTRQDVINAAAAYRARFPDPRRVGHDAVPRLQVDQVLEYLAAQSSNSQVRDVWFSKDLRVTREIDGAYSDGVVFASADQLEVLSRRGYLTLMDATHCTNWLDWLLYTIMVRDECGSWIPVGHFLTEKSDGDIVCEALKTLKNWVFGHCRRDWPLRYFLTDDSAVEQKAVRNAFAGLWADHLLCSVHSERTLRRRFGAPKYREVLAHMLAALHSRRTETGCIQSINAAIQILVARKDEAQAQYIENFWLDSRAQWANYARDHSPLLLQVSYLFLRFLSQLSHQSTGS